MNIEAIAIGHHHLPEITWKQIEHFFLYDKDREWSKLAG
ncbi:hypothetical protein SAMN05216573_1232 [Bradyrhizobium sp. Rc3b]|nr:hypothetical protein SAMN05216573_1232 [Bradyrhizobium sp. Rc3b]